MCFWCTLTPSINFGGAAGVGMGMPDLDSYSVRPAVAQIYGKTYQVRTAPEQQELQFWELTVGAAESGIFRLPECISHAENLLSPAAARPPAAGLASPDAASPAAASR
jgi:hypothetical protein